VLPGNEINMRAIYLKDIQSNSTFVDITEKPFHHLKNVVRVRLNDKVLVLDGAGVKLISKVIEIGKKEIQLKVLSREEEKKVNRVGYVCQVKKEALELIVRQSVEIGLTELVIVKSSRSQNFKINMARIDQIIISAMEQSNFSFKMEVSFIDFSSLIKNMSSKLICFSTESESSSYELLNNHDRSPLIGPEGGFSDDEIESLKKASVPLLKLKTPILRAETAFMFAQGMFSRL
jgi:16S rRNA (uracil1498-N3)-methyltransferase